jgi:hypothetical protein
MNMRATLTPHMLDYEEKFTDGGEVRWLPYLMYFHPPGHRSAVVNTDRAGFRYADWERKKISVADHQGVDSVRLIAGSSTVFGIGASADRWTLASCLSANDQRPSPWLNFGGRSFNSTQELLLFVLNRHLLPKVEEIVLFSGFNNLGLARLPAEVRLEHGAFFNCNQFFDALKSPAQEGGLDAVKMWFKGGSPTVALANTVPTMAEQIAYAADLTLRHLDVWRVLADAMGAKLTFVLQPLSGWVRAGGSREEEALFAELDKLGNFSEVYGDILQPEVCLEYAGQLKRGADRMNVNFINLGPVLASSLTPDQWLFVDRIHFTDDGHNFVAQKLLELI